MATEEKTAQIALRLPIALLDKIERYAESLRRQSPGLSLTRSDAMRMLLTRGLGRDGRKVPAVG
jgi:hypothetical protein